MAQRDAGDDAGGGEHEEKDHGARHAGKVGKGGRKSNPFPIAWWGRGWRECTG
jgi:hypothetical protein